MIRFFCVIFATIVAAYDVVAPIVDRSGKWAGYEADGNPLMVRGRTANPSPVGYEELLNNGIMKGCSAYETHCLRASWVQIRNFLDVCPQPTASDIEARATRALKHMQGEEGFMPLIDRHLETEALMTLAQELGHADFVKWPDRTELHRVLGL